jgi:hypothetical protein
MEVHRVPVPNPILLIFERVVLPLNPYLWKVQPFWYLWGIVYSSPWTLPIGMYQDSTTPLNWVEVKAWTQVQVRYLFFLPLQLIAVPKARIRILLFWEVFKEFTVSEWILHRFTWNLDRNTQLICAQLVIERKLQKCHIFSDIARGDHFVDKYSLQASRHIQMM